VDAVWDVSQCMQCLLVLREGESAPLCLLDLRLHSSGLDSWVPTTRLLVIFVLAPWVSLKTLQYSDDAASRQGDVCVSPQWNYHYNNGIIYLIVYYSGVQY